MKIMFSPFASIRVDQGELQILGDEENPVLLAPTSDLSVEYGDPSVENATAFDGIVFRQTSNGTILYDNQYTGGSIIRHCIVKHAGYYRSSDVASIRFDRVSVMLDNVSIQGSWNRSVHGVHYYSPSNSLVMRNVQVNNAGNRGVDIQYPSGGYNTFDKMTISRSQGVGMYVNSPTGRVSLTGAMIQDSGRQGFYLYNARDNATISDSTFIRNGYLYDESQVESNSGWSDFNMLLVAQYVTAVA